MSIVAKQMGMAYCSGIHSALFNRAFPTDTEIYILKGKIFSEGIWGKLA